MNNEKVLALLPVVELLRKTARTNLRMKLINSIKDEQLSYEIVTGRSRTKVKELKKHAERASYHLSKLETANPDYKDLKKDYEDNIKDYEAEIKGENKVIDKRKEAAEDFAKAIKDVETGETKIKRDALSTETSRLINLFMDEAVKTGIDNFDEFVAEATETEDENVDTEATI